MIRLLFLFIILSNICSAQGIFKLSGEVQNPTERKVLITLYRDWVGDEEEYEIKLNDKNQFSFSTSLNHVAYIDFYYADQGFHYWIIEPEDDISMKFSPKNFWPSLKFSGMGSDKLNYYVKQREKFEEKRDFEKEADVKGKKEYLKKPIAIISTNIDGIPDNGFMATYSGIIHIKEPGKYQFKMTTRGGTGSLKINNQQLVYFGNSHQDSSINLMGGDFPFEVSFSKYMDWVKSSLLVFAEGPGIREFIISDASNIPVDLPDPILVQANENTILRSFIDLPSKQRIVHALNFGSPQKINYTFDMDNGSIFQLWRGNFLDATRMWTGRGDGTAKALGAVLFLGNPSFPVNKISSPNAPWKSDTAGMEFTTKGYTLDEQGFPSFKFKILGAAVSDKIKILENRQGIQHEIVVEKSATDLTWRLADATAIEAIAPGLFIVDDKAYYIKVENSESLHPTIREQNGRKELIAPIQDKLTYSILF